MYKLNITLYNLTQIKVEFNLWQFLHVCYYSRLIHFIFGIKFSMEKLKYFLFSVLISKCFIVPFLCRLCTYIYKVSFHSTEINKANYSEELERLRKQLKTEQLLKMQAVNKLAEIMNRKDMSSAGRGKNKVSSADLRKREKECRKLQQELTQV